MNKSSSKIFILLPFLLAGCWTAEPYLTSLPAGHPADPATEQAAPPAPSTTLTAPRSSEKERVLGVEGTEGEKQGRKERAAGRMQCGGHHAH